MNSSFRIKSQIFSLVFKLIPPHLCYPDLTLSVPLCFSQLHDISYVDFLVTLEYIIFSQSLSLPMPFSLSMWNTFLLYPSWTFPPTTAIKNPTYSLNLFLIMSNIDFILLWDCIAYKLLSFIEHLLSARPIISTLHYNHRVITITLILLKEKLKFTMVR